MFSRCGFGFELIFLNAASKFLDNLWIPFVRFSFTILKSIRLPLKNCMPVRSYPLSLPPSLPPSLHPSIPLFMAQSDHIRPMGAIDRVTSIFSSQPSISMLFIISRLSANRTQQKQILFKWFVLCEREIKTEKQTSKRTNKKQKTLLCLYMKT